MPTSGNKSIPPQGTALAETDLQSNSFLTLASKFSSWKNKTKQENATPLITSYKQKSRNRKINILMSSKNRVHFNRL